jgi:hypothetical protein
MKIIPRRPPVRIPITYPRSSMEQPVRTSGDNVVYWEGTALNNTPGEAE